MFSSDVHKRTEVVSYFEAVLIFVIFAFILYALYPKDMLQRQVLAENSNYDLTAIYLENMLRFDPQNKELTVALLRASVKSGQFDLAMKMIEILKKDATVPMLKDLAGFRFEALKVKYFSTNEKQYHQQIRAEIEALLKEVVAENYYDNETLEYWYKGAREFSINSPALFFLYRLLEQEEKALWLEECFYLSADIKDEKMQTECLMRLRKIDTSRYDEWTQQAYYLAVEEGEIDRAISLLKDMASRSTKWRLELAKFYVEIKYFKEGSSEYMTLYRGAHSAQERKRYLMLALQALQYGSLMDEAAALARKYEGLYYKDKQMSRVFIKLYLAAGKLEDAKRVSLERLKYMEQ
jgi:hypothetical protein